MCKAARAGSARPRSRTGNPRQLARGIRRFFITDDNLARNRNWEALFDRMIRLREVDGIKLNLMIQVDTLCHRIPNFIDKAAQAGGATGLYRSREYQP